MITNARKTLGFVRVALVAGVGIPFLMSASAYAQAPDATAPSAAAATAGEGATTERVIVTGSYIPTAEEVTASPLDTLTSQEIHRSGSVDVLTVLQKRNPDFVGGGNIGTTNANISSGTTLGGSIAQIRGFPSLVLYEGRRIADSAAIAVGGAQFSDVALFPAALLQRIEVLKDGASALYGSEAVGGVINIFTKDDYQGAEIGFRYGTTTDAGVAERRGYAIAGVGNETTQVTAGMEYYEMDALFARERDYSNLTQGGTSTFGGHVTQIGARVPGEPTRYVPNGFDFINYTAPVNSPFDTGLVPGSVVSDPAGGAGVGFGSPAFNGYYQPATLGDGGPNDVLNFNLANIPTSTLDTARTSVIAAFNHQVFGKTLELFGNFLYSNSDYQSFLNGQPVTTAGGVEIPPGRPGLNNGDPGFQAGVNNAIYNPFTFGIGGIYNTGDAPPGTRNVNNAAVRNRYQVAPRIFDNNNNFYRFLGGLRSQINEDWMVEAAGYYSKYDITYTNSNLVIADGLNNLIANEGLDFFRLDPIGNGPGQVSGDLFATAFGTNIRSLSSFQRVFDAKIVGFPFSLPAGKVGFTLGGEYRLEGFKVKDSPEVFLASVPIQDINKKRAIQSVFSEISIPIVSSAMNIPAIYSLELNLAGRYDHYDGVDEDAKVPKITLRYQPIKDLTLRATYSNSFIAPNLYQQFGPSSTGFSQALTFNGVPQDQAQVLALSNPDLNPSTAESYTAGLVYSPSFVPGLVVSVDYFRTLQQGIVGGLGGNTILQSANNLGVNSPFAGLVAFGDFPGTPDAIPFTADRMTLADAGILNFDAATGVFTNPNNGAVIGPDQAGVLFGNLGFPTTYVDTQSNLGAQRSEGFDLSLRWNIDMHQAGELELGANAVVFTLYDFKTSVLTDYYNLLGLNGTEFFGVNPDYKLNMYAEYRIWGFTLGFNANYIPETLSAVGRDPELEDQSTFENVDDFFSVDGRLSYTFVRTATEAPAGYSKDGKGTIDKNPVAGAATLSPMDKLLNGLTLTVGCNNMFDEQPPFIDGGNSNTNLAVYDPFGQFFYFEISKKF